MAAGLSVAACGAEVQADDDEEFAEEAIGEGAQELGLCAGTIASTTITGVAVANGIMSATGGYSLGGGANAVYLEYLIDGVLKQSEIRYSGSTWQATQGGITCAAHNLQVNAYPMVVTSSSATTCLDNGTSAASGFYGSPCVPNATLSCVFDGAPLIICDGGGSGGIAPLTAHWRYSWKSNSSSTWTVGDWFEAQWQDVSFMCKPLWYSARVEFKVKGVDGTYSTTRTYVCPNSGPPTQVADEE